MHELQFKQFQRDLIWKPTDKKEFKSFSNKSRTQREGPVTTEIIASEE